MRVLAIDCESNCLSWLMLCQQWGHDVLWWDRKHPNGEMRLAGKGIIPKIIDYDLIRTKFVDWADLIFLADNAHYTDLIEPFRRDGYPVFGPGVEAAEWELHREVGQEVMKKAGLNTIPGVAFDDYDAAAKFVEKHQSYLVSKPSGDANKALSYVAHDAADLIYMLGRWKDNEKYRNDAREHGFILQEKKQGAEFAVGGWYGPGGWCGCWYENLENKKLMVGDLGPNTGEMGTVSMYVKNSKLADLALKPIAKHLKAIDYVGFIDISGMIDGDGEFWPFEFTMRPGWPTFHNQMATHTGDPAQWMVDLLHGKDSLKVKMDVCCVTVVLAIPDFPYSHLTAKEVTGIPVYNCGSDQVHLCEVMIDDNVPVQINGNVVRMPHYVTCGDYVAVVAGCGETITGARRSAYAAVNKVKIPANPFYRTDIGRGRLINDLPLLQKHGFATGFKVI